MEELGAVLKRGDLEIVAWCGFGVVLSLVRSSFQV